MFELDHRTALVTGAATGIGQAIAIGLANAGARLVIVDKPDVSLDETAHLCAEYDCDPFKIAIDICDNEQIRKGMAVLEAELGHIDILVNNAGINRPMPGLEVDQHCWDAQFNTNVRGGFFCAQAVAPMMIQRKFGRIIFISSQSGLIGIPGQIVYCASKGAVINLVRAMGVEWAKHGITVNSVAPTFVETNMTRKRLHTPAFREFVLGKIPRGEIATPADVAHAVVYLASDEAAMVNATTLSVDGGWTAC